MKKLILGAILGIVLGGVLVSVVPSTPCAPVQAEVKGKITSTELLAIMDRLNAQDIGMEVFLTEEGFNKVLEGWSGDTYKDARLIQRHLKVKY